MVIILITPGIALASDIVPTSATRVKHVACLLVYHANNNINCNTGYCGYRGNYTCNPSHCFSLWHGFDFGNQSAAPHLPTTVQFVTVFTPVTMAYFQLLLTFRNGSDFGPSVDPTPQISPFTILLLPTLWYSTVRFRAIPSWLNIHIKCHFYPSSSRRV
jgi:hypothetical protein